MENLEYYFFLNGINRSLDQLHWFLTSAGLSVQDVDAASHVSLEGVLEKLTHFRSEVRAFALTCHKYSNKPELHPERIPLLKACDTLRNDLAPLGVLIKVCWFHWCLTENWEKWLHAYFSVIYCSTEEHWTDVFVFRIEEPPQRGKSLRENGVH